MSTEDRDGREGSDTASKGGGSSTVAGSESEYRMDEQPLLSHDGDDGHYHDDDPHGDGEDGDLTEATGLLGAGTHSHGHSQGTRNEDTWVGSEDFAGLPWWKRPSVGWLLVPYALFTLAFGGSIVPKLNLIIDLICNRYFADRSAHDPNYTFTPVIFGGDNSQCLIPDVQRKVATFTLVISVMIGILSALTAPKLGALSDRYGRKRLLVVCSLGGIVGEIITIFAAKYPETIHYNWLIAGAFCDGLTGSFTAGSVLSHSYTSDCTPPSKRNVAIGYLHACLFTGLAFGPLLAGYFVEWTGSLLSIFYVTLGCHVFFVLFMFFIIPESLSRKRQLAAREKYALEQEARAPAPQWTQSFANLPLGKQFGDAMHSLQMANPFAPLKILFPSGPGSAGLRRNLITLALIDMAILGAAMSAGTVTVLYTEYMFGWGNLEASRFISLVSMVRVFVLMGIFPVVNYTFRIRPARARRAAGAPPKMEKNAGADKLDIWVLRSALLSDVIGVAGYIFVRTDALFVVCAVITAFGGLGSATIQAALSKHVPAERVGQLLGAIGLLHAISRIIAPVIFNGLYAATVESFPQAFFVLLCAVFAVALAASFIVRPHVYMEDDSEPSRPPSNGSDSNRIRRDTLEDDELLPAVS